METHTKLRRPSKDLGVLADQLLRELERLEQEGESAKQPELYRAYLHYAHSLAWEGVARGDLGAPRRVLDHLLALQPIVDAHQLDDRKPVEQAALEVDSLIRSLYLACEAVEDKQVEVRLADRRSETEREILRVLSGSREYLRRMDVYDRLAPEKRPTPARVGQILTELYHDGLLKRIHGRAQGNPNASFYALSLRGIEVCRSLGLDIVVEAKGKHSVDTEAPVTGKERVDFPTMFHQAVSSLADRNLPPQWRRIVAGALANIHAEGPIEDLRVQLARSLSGLVPDAETEKLIQSTLTTWSYRLSPLACTPLASPAESELLSELIRTVDVIFQPTRIRAFKVTDQNVFEPLTGKKAYRPSDHLRQIIRKAERMKQSLFQNVRDGLSEWALFNGQQVDLALEMEGPVKASQEQIENIQAAYFIARSSRQDEGAAA